MLLPWLALFDFLSVRANFKKPIDLYEVEKRSDDFALLVPIFNDIKYLNNIDFLRKYGRNVVLCTTDQETPEFQADLERIAHENGFRISYAPVEGRGKNPWAIYTKTLLAHDAVLKATTWAISEKYVIFIDGDTYVDGDLRLLCGAMEENDFDIASVRVIPSRRETVMEHLQGIEYDIAMRGRLLYPWLTSGAGMIAKTRVMNAVLENHSLFFNGGDIEIGKLAHMMGFRVGHLPMVFYTDVPPTFVRWMNQRKSWMCGKFRHSIINIHHNLNYPFHFIYYSLILYFLYPFKVIEAISHPHLLPLIIALYALVTCAANWKVRSKWMVIYPLYALFQVMISIWQGIWRYLVTVRRTGNLGRIRIIHRQNVWRSGDRHRLPERIVNLSLICLTTFIIVTGTIEPIQYLLIGRTYPLVAMLADGWARFRELAGLLQLLARNVFAENHQLSGYMAVLVSVLIGAAVQHVWGKRHTASGIRRWAAAQNGERYKVSKRERSLKRELRRIDRAIELNPTAAHLFSYRAELLDRLGKHDLALDNYLRALDLLELRPDEAFVTLRRRQQAVHLEQTRPFAKRSNQQKSVYRHTLAEAYSIRAYQHLKEAQLVEAYNHFVRAFQISPSVADLYQILMLQHKMEKAGAHMGLTQLSLTPTAGGD